MTGLEEVRRLRSLYEKGLITLEFVGERPRFGLSEEEWVSEVNYSIRELARSLGAVLVTGDPIHYRISQAYGLEVLYVAPREKIKLEFEKYFDEDTMSVHLKEGVEPLAKKVNPGSGFILFCQKLRFRRKILRKWLMRLLRSLGGGVMRS